MIAITSYLQADLLGIPVIRLALTYRPSDHIHMSFMPNQDQRMASILSYQIYFLQHIINIKYLFASEFLSAGGDNDDGKSYACSPIHYMTTQDE